MCLYSLFGIRTHDVFLLKGNEVCTAADLILTKAVLLTKSFQFTLMRLVSYETAQSMKIVINI